MSSIVVFRGTGDKKGQDIVDALLSSTSAKLERGRVELDEHAMPIQSVSLDITYRPGVRLGQLVDVHDSTIGASWRGKITGIAHRITKTSHVTELSIARPTEEF
jgi:hypothetical protein